MLERSRLLLLLLLSHPIGVAGQAADSAKQFTALRIDNGRLQVDGRLDEPAWTDAAWRSDFSQKDPVEGGSPSGRTEVAFFYDDHALYVGARMLSPDAANIPATVTRRDQFSDAENLVVALDTYHDRRTAYTFVITSGGVRIDYHQPSDFEDDRDLTWDPVWQAKTSITGTGWTAELRIPFSQLRFSAAGNQTWGVQINRWMPHVNEDVYWIVIPKNENGWSSRFGLLTGIEGVKPARRVELLPYVAGNGGFADAPAGDPFNDGSEYTGRVGLDFKMGLGPNLTLDATVNPDFGQVEADPAEVNLSAFETFFSERRPFFTEGSNLLEGNGPGYFYSRRIGTSPRGDATGDFVDRPDNATILGAAKVTGRLRSGTSIGFLTAFTGREEARTYDAATRRYGRSAIEPFTVYGVGRVQQEFGENQSVVGLALTTVNRSLGDTALAALLANRAITGGGDWNFRFKDGAYQLGGFVGFSHIAGDAAAITRVQQAPAHFLQRPDATEFEFDPGRTSLTGWTAGINASKNAGEHWVGSVRLGAESPYFELNDMGRTQSANDLDASVQLRYRENTPGRLFHRWSSNFFFGRGWNFAGIPRYTELSLGNSFTFRNYWQVFVGVFGSLRAQSDDLTRGGPLTGDPEGIGGDLELSSNEGKPVVVSTRFGWLEDEAGGWRRILEGELQARPSPRVRLSIEPGWRRELVSRQFVGTETGGSAATFGTRYQFAFVDRTTLSAAFRVNYAFTPDLSLELYGEPFAASGRYRDFGELPKARSFQIRKYGTDGTTIVRQPDGSRDVTDGAQSFTISNRDFNVLSFRSNLVLRWEWRAGSTLFLVWQQDRFGDASRGVGVGSLFDSFKSDGQQFLALKVSYWLAAR